MRFKSTKRHSERQHLGLSGAVRAGSDTMTRAAEAGCIMKSFGKLLSYPESTSELQRQHNLVSLQFWPLSSSPFSAIPLSVHVLGTLTHPFLVSPQEQRGRNPVTFPFNLFLHFMTNLITPMTKPHCTPTSPTAHL